MRRFESTTGLVSPSFPGGPDPHRAVPGAPAAVGSPAGPVSTVTLVPVGGRGGPWDLVFHGRDVFRCGDECLGHRNPSGLDGRLTAYAMTPRPDLPPGGTWCSQEAPRCAPAKSTACGWAPREAKSRIPAEI